MKTQNFEIIAAQSQIEWTGRKVTGAHNGTISIKAGKLDFNDGRLSGGYFLADTTAITILDVTDPVTNAQFAGHLASDDFFNSADYPEAKLIIDNAEPRDKQGYHINGALSIKGITHPVSFDAEVHQEADLVTAKGKITIDRTKYDMKFRSGNFFKDLGDTLIYNNFDLNVSITAKAQI
jgi:polyisoprenoid-binding protein YceI